MPKECCLFLIHNDGMEDFDLGRSQICPLWVIWMVGIKVDGIRGAEDDSGISCIYDALGAKFNDVVFYIWAPAAPEGITLKVGP